MSWECFPAWVMASAGTAAAPAAIEQFAVDATEAGDITINFAAVETSSETATEKEGLDTTAEVQETATKTLADDAAPALKHTGINTETGCRACAREYEIAGQTQADFAGREVEEKEQEQPEGGSLDQLASLVM